MTTHKRLLHIPDIERLIHGSKTTLACLIGFFVIKLFGFRIDQWLIITIMVVMCAQLNVGSMLQKSYSRFLGTLTGSLLAALTLLVFPHSETANALITAISAAGFSYLATSESRFSDAGTLGAVTVTTILIGQSPSLLTAGTRFIEISIGIFIAAIVSQFIFPIQAKSHLRRTQTKTILQLRNYFSSTLLLHPTQETVAHYRYLDEEIVKSLSSQRNLAKQSRQELLGGAFSNDHFKRLLQCEKELFRSMICMHYAYKMLPSGRELLASNVAIENFNKAILLALENLAPCFINQSLSQTLVNIPSIVTLKESLEKVRAYAPQKDWVYIDGFLFGAELLVIQLIELVVIIKKTIK